MSEVQNNDPSRHQSAAAAEALLTRAKERHVAGDLPVAIELCAQIVAIAPFHFEAHYLLGTAHQSLGNANEAIGPLRRATELRPDVADVHQCLAIALAHTGRLDEAIACCRRALALNPSDPLASVNLGLLLEEQENLDEAVVCYRRVLKLKPGCVETLNHLGLALSRRKEFAEAVDCFRLALELEPDRAETYQNLCAAYAPYDQASLKRLADALFDLQQSRYPPGTIERSRFLSDAIGKGFPTGKLTEAYFENLELLFAERPKRARPGAVVLGLGSGRCGSTTLSAAFGAVSGACATHENPPFIYWRPEEEQVAFHMRRLRLLADYHPLVFDAAPWWLNVLERFFAEFPEGKAVGLFRETGACAESFHGIMGRGRQSVNYFAPPENGLWAAAAWDPVFPSLPVPSELLPDVDAAKRAMIERYVDQYNHTLRSLAERYPDRLLLVRTEDLNDPATAARLSELVGTPLQIPQAKLNVQTTSDGIGACYRL